MRPLTGVQLQLVAQPDEALRRAIQAPLLAFNGAQGGSSAYQTLALSLTGANGKVCGGFWGSTAYGWLYTQLLAVPEDQRRSGLGRQLMLEAEAEALRRGCRNAWVDTIFGAKGFYERLGYEEFGRLPEHPPGFVRSFLKKDLAP